MMIVLQGAFRWFTVLSPAQMILKEVLQKNWRRTL